MFDNNGVVVYEDGHSIGLATNNEAEYSALCFALYQAKEMGCTHFVVKSDSRLVVNQISGEWRIHENHLKPYVDEIQSEIKDLEEFDLSWIPRRENKLADALTHKRR